MPHINLEWFICYTNPDRKLITCDQNEYGNSILVDFGFTWQIHGWLDRQNLASDKYLTLNIRTKYRRLNCRRGAFETILHIIIYVVFLLLNVISRTKFKRIYTKATTDEWLANVLHINVQNHQKIIWCFSKIRKTSRE